MRLFAVRLPDGSLVTSERTKEVVYFDDKQQAKKVRDRYADAVVVLGPDHARFTH